MGESQETYIGNGVKQVVEKEYGRPTIKITKDDKPENEHSVDYSGKHFSVRGWYNPERWDYSFGIHICGIYVGQVPKVLGFEFPAISFELPGANSGSIDFNHAPQGLVARLWYATPKGPVEEEATIYRDPKFSA